MNKTDIDEMAVEIYNLVLGDRVEQEPWPKAASSVKAFYRNIARWHLGRVEDYRTLVAQEMIKVIKDAFKQKG